MAPVDSKAFFIQLLAAELALTEYLRQLEADGWVLDPTGSFYTKEGEPTIIALG